MNAVIVLTSRNLRLYFRDRAGVFFSLLSALILIALYALFLGKLQIDSLTAKLPQASTHDVHWFVNAWVFAGITMITTLTTALGALSVFVEDNASGRFQDFIVSPIRRSSIILGYFFSSFLVSVFMTMVIVIIGQIYMMTQGDQAMSIPQLAQVLGLVALSSAAFASLSTFIVTFLKSTGAFAALSTVVGTVVGFLAGAYIPVGTLPEGVVRVLNALPFAQSAMLLRGPYTANALDAITAGDPQAIDSLQTFYGMTASLGSFDISSGFAVAILCTLLVLFAVSARGSFVGRSAEGKIFCSSDR